MSISNLQNNSTSNAQHLLGRSLERVARQLPPTDSSDQLAVSGKFDTQRQQVQSDLADVQNATTTAQAAGSLLDHVADLLEQMTDLAKNLPADGAAAQSQFSALQNDVRTALNADGLALRAEGNPALKALVAQDSDRHYLVTLSSPDLGGKLTAASKQVATDRAVNAGSLEGLQRRAASLQVENANLDSTLQQLQSGEDADAATQWAKQSLFSGSSAALAAQGAGRGQGSVYKLLQE